MKIPLLNRIRKTEETITTFLGYNVRASGEKTVSGRRALEFVNMENLTGDEYPVLSTSRKRYGSPTYRSGDTIYGMINKDALCVVSGNNSGAKLYVNNLEIVGITLTATQKQLVSMGAYLIIFPDKKWINTKNLTEYGSIDATFTTATDVTYTLCKADATAYGTPTVSPTAPADPANGDLWIDTSNDPHVLKEYSEASETWTTILTTFIKAAATNIAEHFEAGDAVSISGSTVDINGDGVYIEAAQHNENGTGDYIVVPGILDQTTTQSTAVTVARTMPAVDYVTESNNRLWACRYGTDNSGNVVNEIYACKLGDFKNWNCFQGLSTDSYAASVGTDGPFTGACTYRGYPLFWKEEWLHKIYGDYPANFQISAARCDGVQKTAYRSIAIVNSILYYKGVSGIFAYDGSLPVKISNALDGTYNQADAVAGAYGLKYFVVLGMRTSLTPMVSTTKKTLYVYDTGKGMWHKREEMAASCFCTAGNTFYAGLDEYGSIRSGVYTMEALANTGTWFFETGYFNVAEPERQYISNVIIRASKPVNVYVDYGSGTWTQASVYYPTEVVGSTNPKTYLANVRLLRCDCFRLKVSGSGDTKLYSLTKIIKNGSYKP